VLLLLSDELGELPQLLYHNDRIINSVMSISAVMTDKRSLYSAICFDKPLTTAVADIIPANHVSQPAFLFIYS